MDRGIYVSRYNLNFNRNPGSHLHKLNCFRFKFGLYQVNFNDSRRTRSAKSSVNFYKQVIRTKKIPDGDIENDIPDGEVFVV